MDYNMSLFLIYHKYCKHLNCIKVISMRFVYVCAEAEEPKQ